MRIVIKVHLCIKTQTFFCAWRQIRQRVLYLGWLSTNNMQISCGSTHSWWGWDGPWLFGLRRYRKLLFLVALVVAGNIPDMKKLNTRPIYKCQLH
jgi:hypothetical protein